MPLFYYLDDLKKQNIQKDFISFHDRANEQRGNISPAAEYRNLVGEEYKNNFKQAGKLQTGSKPMRQADVRVAERMYAFGYSKTQTLNAIKNNSPMMKDMTPLQRSMYLAKVGRSMKKVKPLRQEIAADKKMLGIKSNRVKDIKDYGKITSKQGQADKAGIKTTRPTFKEFQRKNDKNYQNTYAKKVDGAIQKKRESKQRSPQQIANSKPRKQSHYRPTPKPQQEQQKKRGRRR